MHSYVRLVAILQWLQTKSGVRTSVSFLARQSHTAYRVLCDKDAGLNEF
jgi:hypothetical protein